MGPTAIPTRITIDFRDAMLPSRTWILGVDEAAPARVELIAFDGSPRRRAEPPPPTRRKPGPAEPPRPADRIDGGLCVPRLLRTRPRERVGRRR